MWPIAQSNQYGAVSFSRDGPSFLKQAFQLRDYASVLRILREIDEFMRVLFMVVQLDAARAIAPFGVTPAFRAHGPSHEPAGRVAALHLRVSGTVPAELRLVEQRPQARARKMVRRDQT